MFSRRICFFYHKNDIFSLKTLVFPPYKTLCISKHRISSSFFFFFFFFFFLLYFHYLYNVEYIYS